MIYYILYFLIGFIIITAILMSDNERIDSFRFLYVYFFLIAVWPLSIIVHLCVQMSKWGFWYQWPSKILNFINIFLFGENYENKD